MITLTVVALLRLVPYLFAAANAWTKGYKWLTIAMVYVSVLAVVNFSYEIPRELSGLLSSIFALLILFHALDIKPKQK
jgi:hypothetical protein